MGLQVVKVSRVSLREETDRQTIKLTNKDADAFVLNIFEALFIKNESFRRIAYINNEHPEQTLYVNGKYSRDLKKFAPLKGCMYLY